MISLLSMTINTIANAFVYIIKAFFSMLSWFISLFFKILKYFYVVLPVTSICFLMCFVLDVIMVISKRNISLDALSSSVATSDSSNASSSALDMPAIQEGSQEIMDDAKQNADSIITELSKWWHSILTQQNNTLVYILLIVATIVMFVPVVSVLLSISVLVSYRQILFIALCIDLGIYLIRALFGKNFVEQALSRYYRLFKEAGRKHQEKEYDKLLKQKTKEMRSRAKANAFYVDDFYDDDYDDQRFDEKRGDNYDEYEQYNEDDEYESDYYEDEYDYTDDDEDLNDYEDDDEYIDNYEDDDEYIDDHEDDDEYIDDYEDDDEYNDGKYNKKDRRNKYSDDSDSYYDDKIKKEPTTSFDFFAGCNSKESVDKKYKSLVKLYHPDNMDGDTKALQEINVQYTSAKRKYS